MCISVDVCRVRWRSTSLPSVDSTSSREGFAFFRYSLSQKTPSKDLEPNLWIIFLNSQSDTSSLKALYEYVLSLRKWGSGSADVACIPSICRHFGIKKCNWTVECPSGSNCQLNVWNVAGRGGVSSGPLKMPDLNTPPSAPTRTCLHTSPQSCNSCLHNPPGFPKPQPHPGSNRERRGGIRGC